MSKKKKKKESFRTKVERWLTILGGGVLVWSIGMGYFQTVVDWAVHNLFWLGVIIVFCLVVYAYVTGKIKNWLNN